MINLGKCGLREELTKLFKELKDDIGEAEIETINILCKYTSIFDNDISKLRSSIREEDKTSTITIEKEIKVKEKISYIVNKSLVEILTQCGNDNCKKPLSEEEIFSGWPKDLNTYKCQCKNCKQDFTPKLLITKKRNKTKLFELLSPVVLNKEITNIISNKGCTVFYKPDLFIKHKIIFWNLIFYFRLLLLPTIMLELKYSKEVHSEISKILKKLPNYDIKPGDMKVFISPGKFIEGYNATNFHQTSSGHGSNQFETGSTMNGGEREALESKAGFSQAEKSRRDTESNGSRSDIKSTGSGGDSRITKV